MGYESLSGRAILRNASASTAMMGSRPRRAARPFWCGIRRSSPRGNLLLCPGWPSKRAADTNRVHSKCRTDRLLPETSVRTWRAVIAALPQSDWAHL